MHYVSDGERKRIIGNVTYEHKFVNAGFDYLDADDQTLPTTANIPANGYSIWATPRIRAETDRHGRTDPVRPLDAQHAATPSRRIDRTGLGTTRFSDQHQNRTIFGIAYWFPHQGNVSAAMLVDYDAQSFDNITAHPTKAMSRCTDCSILRGSVHR